MNEDTELILYAVYRKKKDGTRELLCRTLDKNRAEALMMTAYNKEVLWSGGKEMILIPQVDGELES